MMPSHQSSSYLFWLSAASNGQQIKESVKQITEKDGRPDQVLIVLDESSDVSSAGRSFGEYYWLIRDAYKYTLAALSVEDGLKTDIQVFIYPDYLKLSALQQDIFVYAFEGTSLPKQLQEGKLRTFKSTCRPCTPSERIQHLDFDQLKPAGYDVVALGGTFDRLHAGHKLMLSAAIILAKSTIVIGLTDSTMLSTKKYLEVLLPYEERKASLMQFVSTFCGPRSLAIDVAELYDAYGPTITNPKMDLLVVSEETLPGAEQINRIRTEKGMSELRIVPVEFVKLPSGERISSTLIRSQFARPLVKRRGTLMSSRIVAAGIEKFLNEQIVSGSLSDEKVESLQVALQCLQAVYELDSVPVSQVPNLEALLEKCSLSSSPANQVSDADRKEAERLKNSGNDHMTAGRAGVAIECYSKAINLDPSNIVFYSNRAAAYQKDGKYDLAVADCKKALAMDSKFVKAHTRLGAAYGAQKKTELATQAYKKALELEPDNAVARAGLESLQRDSSASPARGSAGGSPFGGAGGMPDLASMMNNPEMMAMAQNMMKSGALDKMMKDPKMMNMMKGMMGGAMPAAEEEEEQ